MKPILLFLTLCVLGVTGCTTSHQNHSGTSMGVDHGEHPGDLDHGDTMQK